MKSLRLIAVLAMLSLAACSTINKDPAALHGDYSGKDSSGSFAVILAAGDIPGVPESKGKRARWSDTEVEQVLYLDADCQAQLYEQLPGWARAIVEEGGFSALAVAVGQVGFAAAFPGADLVRYFLGGLGYGAFAGANTGRYRQDSSQKAAVGYCVIMQIWEAKKRYGILEGVNAILWYGDGQSTIPKAINDRKAPTLPRVGGNDMPPIIR